MGLSVLQLWLPSSPFSEDHELVKTVTSTLPLSRETGICDGIGDEEVSIKQQMWIFPFISLFPCSLPSS